jgi:hypothetical protein
VSDALPGEPVKNAPAPAPASTEAPLSNYAIQDRQPVPAAPVIRARVEMKPMPSGPSPAVEEPPAVPPEFPPPKIVTGEVPTSTTRTAESVSPSVSLPEAPLVGALRRALEKHPQEAAQFLERYEKPNREMLLALLNLAVGLGEGDLDRLSAQELAGTLEQLQSIRATLCRKVPLKLEKVGFCRTIESFGQYDPLPADHTFQAGADDHPGERVQIYAEVRNFSSVPRKGAFETVLKSTIEIKDLQGRTAVKMSLDTTTDRSQSPRQDYFLNFQFPVPAHLPAGSYTLWLTVKDVTPPPGSESAEAGDARESRSSLDFRVMAPAVGKETLGRE